VSYAVRAGNEASKIVKRSGGLQLSRERNGDVHNLMSGPTIVRILRPTGFDDVPYGVVQTANKTQSMRRARGLAPFATAAIDPVIVCNVVERMLARNIYHGYIYKFQLIVGHRTS